MLTKFDLYIALMYFIWKTGTLYLQQDLSFQNKTMATDWCDDLLEEVESTPTSTELICYMST
jgi:hypothetical protein